jgi:DNA modification methylase
VRDEDPFLGAGTVGVVAQRLGRAWTGIELNPAYARLAELRIARDDPVRHVETLPVEMRKRLDLQAEMEV